MSLRGQSSNDDNLEIIFSFLLLQRMNTTSISLRLCGIYWRFPFLYLAYIFLKRSLSRKKSFYQQRPEKLLPSKKKRKENVVWSRRCQKIKTVYDILLIRQSESISEMISCCSAAWKTWAIIFLLNLFARVVILLLKHNFCNFIPHK